MNLTDTQNLIARIEPGTKLEQVCESINLIDAMSARLKELKEQHTEKLVEWIQANGPFEIGSVKYYVGDRSDTKCLDVHRFVERGLEVTSGDLSAVTCCLSSNAVKHGAAKKLLPAADYDELFETTRKPRLLHGVAQSQLQRVDTKFITG